MRLLRSLALTATAAWWWLAMREQEHNNDDDVVAVQAEAQPDLYRRGGNTAVLRSKTVRLHKCAWASSARAGERAGWLIRLNSSDGLNG